MSIRLAIPSDASEIQAIYAHYCESTVISFESEAPSVTEMAGRMARVQATLPWLVAVTDGHLDGYAYATQHRERAAYRWSVDVSVYLRTDCRGRGLGRALYTPLLQILRTQGYVRAHAGITLPNPASVGLHEAMGFTFVGAYPDVGYKVGAWHATGWWTLALRTVEGEPAEPRGIGEVGSGLG